MEDLFFKSFVSVLAIAFWTAIANLLFRGKKSDDVGDSEQTDDNSRQARWVEDDVIGIIVSVISILIVVTLLIIGFYSWPVSLWLIFAIITSLILKNIHSKNSIKSNYYTPNKNIFFKESYYFAIKNLLECSIGVVIGLSIIVIVQALLCFLSDKIEVETVLYYEIMLSSLNQKFDSLLGIKYFIFSIVLLLFLTIFFPNIPLLNKYMKVRDYLNKLTIVIATLISFSFFSIQSISNYEKTWIASFAKIMSDRISKIEKLQREVTSLKWIEMEIDLMPYKTKCYLKEVFNISSKKADSKIILNRIIERISKSIPMIDNSEVEKINSIDSVLKKEIGYIEKIQKKYNDNNKNSTRQKLYLNDLKHIPKEINNIEKGLKEGKSVIVEAIEKSVNQFIPSELRPITKSFISSLTKSIAESTLSIVIPKSVKDVATAYTWINLCLKPNYVSSKTTYKSQLNWMFSISKVTTKTNIEPVIAADRTVHSIESEIINERTRKALELEMMRRLNIYKLQNKSFYSNKSTRKSYRPPPRQIRVVPRR